MITVETASIGAGVLAAIIIAVIIGVVAVGAGSKKGYELIKLAREQKEKEVMNNPLYEGINMEVVNPIYEDIIE